MYAAPARAPARADPRPSRPRRQGRDRRIADRELAREQASAGLDRLTPGRVRRASTRANAAYRERFGFPFVICVRDHDKASILRRRRRAASRNDRAAEVATALGPDRPRSSRLRLEGRGGGVSKLTTHVLDTANGKPAAGVRIELYRVGAPGAPRRSSKPSPTPTAARRRRCWTARTSARHVPAGVQRGRLLRVARPRRRETVPDVVPVVFVVDDPAAGYHVPLLVSPWAYSTYRGS